MPDKPYWANDCLRGICFWLGHRYANYPFYHLGEAAIVGELCNLLNARLKRNERLLCEVYYKNMGLQLGESRADLVIIDSEGSTKRGDDVTKHLKCVIEVKRAENDDTMLRRDLYRLKLLQAALKDKIEAIGFYLLIVSQRSRPSGLFVTEEGYGYNQPQSLKYDDKETGEVHTISYRTPCVSKASSTFQDSAIESAYYSVLVEVLNS